jgi:hypothetical protein
VVVVIGGLVVDVVLGGGRVVVSGPPDVAPDVGAVVGATEVDGVVLDDGVLDGGVVVAGLVGGVELADEPGCSRATVIPITVVTPPATSTAVLVSLRTRASARSRTSGEYRSGTRLMAPRGGAAPAPARGHLHGPRLADSLDQAR